MFVIQSLRDSFSHLFFFLSEKKNIHEERKKTLKYKLQCISRFFFALFAQVNEIKLKGNKEEGEI